VLRAHAELETGLGFTFCMQADGGVLVLCYTVAAR
jgi:hypothetical protein